MTWRWVRRPRFAMVAYAVAMSMMCGEDGPRMLIGRLSSPGVSAGTPSLIAACFVFFGPISMFMPTYAVLMEFWVALSRVIGPDASPSESLRMYFRPEDGSGYFEPSGNVKDNGLV